MEFFVFTFWLGFSLIIGALGRHRNIGFLFAFLWSILLSPIIGLAITLFSKTRVNQEQNKSAILNQLEQINNLKEKGILNEVEFTKEKAELLGKLNNPTNESSSSKKAHIIALLLLPIILIGGAFAIKFYYQAKHTNADLETPNNIPTDTIQNQQTTAKSQINENNEQFGYVSGSMYYESEGIPNSIRLIFENIDTGEKIELDYDNCMDEGYNYKMKLPIGNYYVFEDGFPTFVIDDGSDKPLKDNDTKKYYYTLSCNGKSQSHTKQIVKVMANKLVTDVIPCDEIDN